MENCQVQGRAITAVAVHTPPLPFTCSIITKFFHILEVTHWPKEDYGRFYNGDSYIILNTYKKNPSGEVHLYVAVFITFRYHYRVAIVML